MYDEEKKKKLIKKEKKRLEKIYGELADEKKSSVSGLIERAAFMRVSLEEIEIDLDENGYTEKFSQGNQEPYDRKRPIAEIYSNYSGTYLKIMKQLSDMLPKEQSDKKEDSDGFDEFVRGRS